MDATGFDLDTYKNDTRIQDQLEAPMPWIGMYIASASLICSLAMAADTFNGFRTKRLWFPCKYFPLNATSLTLLAVAMKLPVDLTTAMFANIDWLAKLSSLIFMSASVGNFISSLGSMNDKEILTNVTALAILIITITVNVWIQLIQLKPLVAPEAMLGELLLATVYMLILLVALVSSAISVPTIKRILGSKYKEMQRVVQREEQREAAIKYWLMAETGSPQFAIARSVVCTSGSAVCVVAALTLTEAYIRAIILCKGVKSFWEAESVYGWSTKWILLVQTFGVAVGTITPLSRWFLALRSRCSENRCRSFGKDFDIESHWTQRLVDWRDSFSSSQILRHHKCRKYLYCAKSIILNFFIQMQILVVLVSRIHVRVSASIMSPFFSCFGLIHKSEHPARVFTSNGSQLDLSRYLLLLEGETELHWKTSMNIYHQAERVMQKGERMQPENLINLLQKLGNFRGVIDFDSSLVPSLHSQEPPNCWSLPVVTLASIAVSLPNIANHEAKQLVRSVSEGLSLVKLVDDTLDTDGELVSIKNAAGMIWVGVELFWKWQNEDLHETSLKGKNAKEVLQELSSKAEMTVLEFKRDVRDFHMENPVNWPVKVIAANSMYRISQTILLSHNSTGHETEAALFERLRVMIADILAACLTNLAYVVTTKCHRNAIEEREKSVHEAFLLLGKTRQIVELVQKQEWPCLDPDKAACIEEWRALFQQDNENPRQP